MSFDPFQPPRFIFNDSGENQLLLGNLHAVPGPNRLWLHITPELRSRIYRQSSLNPQDLQRRGEFASFYVEMFPQLKEALANNMIYGTPTSELYYLDLFEMSGAPGQFRMIAKYQQILGFRFMFDPSPDFVDAMVAEMVQALKVERKDLFEEPYASTRSASTAPGSPPTEVGQGTTEQVELQALLLDGDVIRLPVQHLKHYARIKLAIEKAGGRYNARGYFDFPPGIDAGEVLEQLQVGKAIHVRKDHQFFRTPHELARTVVDAVGPLAGKRILEPSAGDGALADLVRAAGAEVVTIENWNVNVLKLKSKGYDVLDRDFLSVTPEEIGRFDAIVANPPFTRGLDIVHVEHMLKFLKPGATLSVLTSTSWETGSQRKQVAFRKMLEERQAYVERVAPGAFKSSGTQVGAMHITLTATEMPRAVSTAEQSLLFAA